jgi:hypothetical protein
LTDGIALIVVTGARKGEEFSLKVRQPMGSFRQEDLARLEFRRGDRLRLALSPTGFTAMIPQISCLSS